MRQFVPMEIPRDFDHRLVKILRNLDEFAGAAQAGFGAIARGESPNGSRTPIPVSPGVLDHGLLKGLVPTENTDGSVADYNDDHTQYALLPGRPDGQVYNGTRRASAFGSWATAGAFTAENSKSAGSSWSGINIDTSAAVGDVIILHLATGPFAIDLDAETNYHSTITDTQGNTWTKMKEYSYSDAFLNGTTASIWACVVGTALTAGVDTLTATYTSSIGKMSISSHRFTVSGAGADTVTVELIDSLRESDFSGSGPGAIALSGGVSGVEYLWIRSSAIGNAGSSGVSGYNSTSNYTAFSHSGAPTVGATDNVAAYGEYRIRAATNGTTDPQAGGGTGGYFSSVYVALGIVPATTGTLKLRAYDSENAAQVFLDGETLRLKGDAINFYDAGGGSILSYIRTSTDGAFVGPIEASGSDVHPDDIFRIVGSGDPTKKVAFEVDGLTTATTRTLTVPDADGTLLLTSRQINTTAPLTGGGALSADLTLAVSTFGSGNSGVVPASGGGTTNFLRADGTWAAPPGGAGGTSSISRLFAFMGA